MYLSRALVLWGCHLHTSRAALTARAYLRDVGGLIRHLSDRRITRVCRDDLRLWIESLRQRGLAPATIVRAVAAMRQFFAFLQDEGHLSVSPAARVRGPKIPRRVPIYLSEAELAQLLAIPDQTTWRGSRNHAMLTVLAYTGVRLSELIGLRLCDVDLAEGTLRVFGKGARERLLPLNARAAQALTRWLAIRPENGTDRLWITTRGRAMATASVQNWFKRELAAKLSRRFSAHKLRHTFATMLHRAGVDLLTIQRLLGHDSIVSTQVYAHADQGQLRRAVERLVPQPPPAEAEQIELPLVAGTGT